MIWGFWRSDDKSSQIWVIQESLLSYGSKLDIVFDDPNFPGAGK